jgi:hypothetical protein
LPAVTRSFIGDLAHTIVGASNGPRTFALYSAAANSIK